MEVTKRADDRVHGLFFDPTGKHLLISMASGDNYYLYARWKKVKALPKLKVRRCGARHAAGGGVRVGGVDPGFRRRGRPCGGAPVLPRQ
jgi:hypothetical protein